MQIPAKSITLAWPRRPSSRAITVALRIAGVVLLGLVGLIHLQLASLYYLAAPYIGVLFYMVAAGAALGTAAIAAGVRGAWIAGALVAAGSLGGLLLSSTIGLPGFMESLSAPWATASLWCEGAFLAVYAAAVAVRRSPLGA